MLLCRTSSAVIAAAPAAASGPAQALAPEECNGCNDLMIMRDTRDDFGKNFTKKNRQFSPDHALFVCIIVCVAWHLPLQMRTAGHDTFKVLLLLLLLPLLVTVVPHAQRSAPLSHAAQLPVAAPQPTLLLGRRPVAQHVRQRLGPHAGVLQRGALSRVLAPSLSRLTFLP